MSLVYYFNYLIVLHVCMIVEVDNIIIDVHELSWNI